MATRTMKPNVRDALNHILRYYGLTISGASKGPNPDDYWWISIETVGGGSYNKDRVAAVLMKQLECETIILDGEVFGKPVNAPMAVA